MFDFDDFINKSSIHIFGQDAIVIPANSEFSSFKIRGDFHESYQELSLDTSNSNINSDEIVIFIRSSKLPHYYSKINQGDMIKISGKYYEIIDVQTHIPGSKKLVLHES